jgi:hypothetical protein
MSPVEVATLASIVQAETVRIDDAKRIAGVYRNRLRIGMPLQADPTLKFALGLAEISRVLNVDKQVTLPTTPTATPDFHLGRSTCRNRVSLMLFYKQRSTITSTSVPART